MFWLATGSNLLSAYHFLENTLILTLTSIPPVTDLSHEIMQRIHNLFRCLGQTFSNWIYKHLEKWGITLKRLEREFQTFNDSITTPIHCILELVCIIESRELPWCLKYNQYKTNAHCQHCSVFRDIK